MFQNFLSDAATNAGDFLNTGLDSVSATSHELALADPINIHLGGGVLLPAVLVCWFFAFRRYWRLRNMYGKRALVDHNSDKIRLRGELTRLSLRLLVPVAMAAALLNPYLPGVPHLVPLGPIATMPSASPITAAWAQSTLRWARQRPHRSPAPPRQLLPAATTTSSSMKPAAVWTWCAT